MSDVLFVVSPSSPPEAVVRGMMPRCVALKGGFQHLQAVQLMEHRDAVRQRLPVVFLLHLEEDIALVSPDLVEERAVGHIMIQFQQKRA